MPSSKGVRLEITFVVPSLVVNSLSDEKTHTKGHRPPMASRAKREPRLIRTFEAPSVPRNFATVECFVPEAVEGALSGQVFSSEALGDKRKTSFSDRR